jgi:hypothetical protein
LNLRAAGESLSGYADILKNKSDGEWPSEVLPVKVLLKA